MARFFGFMVANIQIMDRQTINVRHSKPVQAIFISPHNAVIGIKPPTRAKINDKILTAGGAYTMFTTGTAGMSDRPFFVNIVSITFCPCM